MWFTGLVTMPPTQLMPAAWQVAQPVVIPV
jgi:hypothetical protein